VVDFTQVHTNSTAFFIISSETSQYNAIVPNMAMPHEILDGPHANAAFTEPGDKKPAVNVISVE
jgi:hypothetical protein